MQALRTFLAIGAALAVTLPAFASPRCHVAMTEWKPREALEDKLKAEGWQFHRIKTDDGCYKVYGRKSDGQRVKAIFAPDTLMLIREKPTDD